MRDVLLNRHRFIWTALVLLAGACQGSAPPAVSPSAASEQATPSQPAGTPSPAAELNLVTIGDSIPYAKEDCGGCPSFTTLLATAIETSHGVAVRTQNLSTHDNLTGARLVERIRTSTPIRTAVAAADIVIVNIGHNDTPWNSLDDSCDGANPDGVFNWASYTGECVTQLAQRHGDDLDAILTEIDMLRAGQPTAIRVLTDYNDIIGWELAPSEATEPSVEVLDAFAAATCQAAEAHDAICVDVYHAFNGPDGRGAAGALLGRDYTHPSAAGQQRIAELIETAGSAPLW
jgi:lysophospholipase L1-like esterase